MNFGNILSSVICFAQKNWSLFNFNIKSNSLLPLACSMSSASHTIKETLYLAAETITALFCASFRILHIYTAKGQREYAFAAAEKLKELGTLDAKEHRGKVSHKHRPPFINPVYDVKWQLPVNDLAQRS